MRWRSFIPLAALTAGCSYAPLCRATTAQLTLTNDNDLWAFRRTDQDYSNLLQLDARVDVGWRSGGFRLLPGGGIGQVLYSPADLREERLAALREDRPYAGWTFALAHLDAHADGIRYRVELRAGIVGPHAFGEETQSAWHSTNRAPRPRGWQTAQLGDALDLAVVPGAAVTVARAPLGDAWQTPLVLDVTAEGRVEVGTLRLSLAPALLFRIGVLRARGAPPSLWAAGTPLPSDEPGRELFAFGGAEGRASARDRVIDGDVCDGDGACGPTWVVRRPYVADLHAGLGATIGPIQVHLAYVARTPELSSPLGAARWQRFGRVAIGFAF